MIAPQLKIVFLGLSITSSWGNGHATTYRGLIKALHAAGHEVLFLERNAEWYASNRDLPNPSFCKAEVYSSIEELKDNFTNEIINSDLIIVGSFVPEGKSIGKWINYTAKNRTAFYDIDTPVTLSKIKNNDCDYLSPELIPQYDLYLSFTGGKTLTMLENIYGSPLARPLYCSVDPDNYFPIEGEKIYDLGYLGTYSNDRQIHLNNLLIKPAHKNSEMKFVVAGPMYPENINWPKNVERIYHLNPKDHNSFYNSQRFTLNITRKDMIAAGYSPSVRLFEASACSTPIISDYWEGLDTFFKIGEEILVANSSDDTIKYLSGISEEERIKIGEKASKKVLSQHTANHRAEELEKYFSEIKKLKVI